MIGVVGRTPGELLGKGAFGRVYLGLDQRTGALMARTLLTPGPAPLLLCAGLYPIPHPSPV